MFLFASSITTIFALRLNKQNTNLKRIAAQAKRLLASKTAIIASSKRCTSIFVFYLILTDGKTNTYTQSAICMHVSICIWVCILIQTRLCQIMFSLFWYWMFVNICKDCFRPAAEGFDVFFSSELLCVRSRDSRERTVQRWRTKRGLA